VGLGEERNNLLQSRMSQNRSAEIATLYRYPVKGLSPEPLASVTLAVGQTLPADRRYALENGPTGFDPASPKWMSKSHFLMLMRNEGLAALQTRFDDRSNVLTVRDKGEVVARGDLESTEGCAEIEAFFQARFAGDLKGPPKVISGGGHSFSDVAKKVVSIINLDSVQAIEKMVGRPVHPLRFRANVYVTGWPAWYEFELPGKIITMGSARLKVLTPITRCAAVNVDPESAARDLDLPSTLMRRLGHNECGIYAEVVADGLINVGDPIGVEAPQLL
jgi:uncharacterized protein